MLENNIQTALAQQSIELEDAIDLRMIKNVKLANQLLKLRRRQKGAQDHERQLEQTEAQGQAQAQASQAAAQSEINKNEAVFETTKKLEQFKSDSELKKLGQEAALKKELMALEFEYNMQLKQAEIVGTKNRETEKEDRKDDRTRMQASQQSELIDQRKNEKPPKNFESAGNDTLGGFNLGAFGPK